MLYVLLDLSYQCFFISLWFIWKPKAKFKNSKRKSFLITPKTKVGIHQLRLQSGPTYKNSNTPTWDGASEEQLHELGAPTTYTTIYQLSYWNATNTQLANFREKANKNTYHLPLQNHPPPCSHIPYKFTYSIWSKNKTIYIHTAILTD